MSDRWSIDPSRVAISGFSAGAANALRFVAQRAELFPNALVVEGGDPQAFWEVDADHVHRTRVRVAILNGSQPGLFRLATDAVATQLKMLGIQFRYRLFDQAKQHMLSKDAGEHVLQSLDWLWSPTAEQSAESKISSLAQLRFEVCVPDDDAGVEARPVLIFFTGATSPIAEWQSRFRAAAAHGDLDGLVTIVLAPPDGSQGLYEDPVDHYQQAIRLLVSYAQEKWSIAPARIYLGGFADGCFYAHAARTRHIAAGELCIDGMPLQLIGSSELRWMAGIEVPVALLLGSRSAALQWAALGIRREYASHPELLRIARFHQQGPGSFDIGFSKALYSTLRWFLDRTSGRLPPPASNSR